MDANLPKPRRRFRFSLRTMFVLVTALCVWLGYQLNWIRQRRNVLGSGEVLVFDEVDRESRLPVCFGYLENMDIP
jgi:hypothetical protein